MITKILFTILVIVGVLLYARRNTGARPVAGARKSAPPTPPWYVRVIPAALLLSLLATVTVTLWLEWQDAHRIFTARVVDTRTGEVRTYPVYRSDVHGRTFSTVDGREITLADVERMELVEGAPHEQTPSPKTP
jgi:hypothetical protein